MKNKQCFINYGDFYISKIRPRLSEIDICLKTMEKPFTVEETADLLDLSVCEVMRIVEEENLSTLGKNEFIQIMKLGSSELCPMFRKELERGSPATYTFEDIAYIYDLDFNDVKKAGECLNIKEATDWNLILIFNKVKKN